MNPDAANFHGTGDWFPIEILARVAAGIGESDRAIAALQKLLSVPGTGPLASTHRNVDSAFACKHFPVCYLNIPLLPAERKKEKVMES